ncbi:MAG: radical SAM protein [Candidatus Omnitrophota bacterium]
MRVALVHCPFDHRSFSENLAVVDREFCHAPPIILAYVAAILEKAGHKVLIVEANALKLSREQTLRILKDFSPDLLGFRVDTYWFHRVVEWASFFKERLKVPVVVGGINMALYPRESLAHPCFDYGVLGEANESLPQLLTALEKGTPLASVPGLAYRAEGEVLVNPVALHMIAFDDYPFPARHLLPNHIYSSFTSQRKNFTIMLTSTGCPCGCSFCAISRNPFRHRSARSVVDEVEECYNDYNVREIDFFSASFFVSKDFVMEFCREMTRRRIQVEWSCRSRVDQVDKELLKEAYAAGCRKIYYGIESVEEDVLKNVCKGIHAGQVRDAVAWTRAAGIGTLGFFMVGNPGDDRKSILATIDFAKELKLDYVQVCRAIAKPNTGLNDRMIASGGRDYWREYILNEDAVTAFPTPWTLFSRREADEYIKWFYRSFYLRPGYIGRRLMSVKSWDELFRFVRVAWKWFVVGDRRESWRGRQKRSMDA